MSEITEALGIAVGDVVWTSYGQPHDYQVMEVSKPKLWFKGHDIVVYSEAVTSLVCKDLKSETRNPSYLNNIRQVGNRWFSEMNDEIFIEKSEINQSNKVYQPDLFSIFEESETPRPYQFQTEIDYKKGVGFVWHCEKCRHDFNTEEKFKRPCWCKCGWVAEPIIYIEFLKGIPTHRYPSTFIVGLNLEDYAPIRELNLSLAATK